MTEEIEDNSWFKVDNAGKLYASTNSPFNDSIYRIAVNMKEEIKPNFLERAVNDLKSRFPTFFIKCKCGLFWAYFEKNELPVVVQPETSYLDQYMNPRKNNKYLFAVYYYKNRISLECLHALSDGYGSLEFLKAIVYRYLEVCGHKMESEGLIRTKEQKPLPEEFEDSYNKYYTTEKIKREKLKKGYYPVGKPLDKRKGYGIILGKMNSAELVAISKKYGASVTQFIASLYVFSVYIKHKNKNKNNAVIQPCVPVNLRGIFPSQTMRNFSLVFYMQFNPKEDLTFQQIIEKTKQYFIDGVKKEKLQAFLNANVSIEKKWFIKVLPYFIKSIALSVGRKMADGLVTRSISNLGIVKMPECMAKHIVDFECAQPDGVSIMTANNIATIAFVRKIAETDIEQFFFNFLAKEGINVEIQSNLMENNITKEKQRK